MKRLSIEERNLHLEMWRDSNLSATAYSHEMGIKRETFYSWIRAEKNMGKSIKQSREHFVQHTLSKPAVIIFNYKGVKIEIPANSLEATLPRILTAFGVSDVS
jgi:hypothetical protein